MYSIILAISQRELQMFYHLDLNFLKWIFQKTLITFSEKR